MGLGRVAGGRLHTVGHVWFAFGVSSSDVAVWLGAGLGVLTLAAAVWAAVVGQKTWRHQSRYVPRWTVERGDRHTFFTLSNGSDETAEEVSIAMGQGWRLHLGADFGTMYPGDRRSFTAAWDPGADEALVTITWRRPAETVTRTFTRRLPEG